MVKATAGGVMLYSGTKLSAPAFWQMGRMFDGMAARLIENPSANARWVKFRWQIRKHLVKSGKAAFLGTMRRGILGFGRAAIYASFINMLCLGPAGVGKDTKVMQPMSCALAGHAQTIACSKGDTDPTLGDALRSLGVDVESLDIGGVLEGINSATYNPLHLILDAYLRRNGSSLADITADVDQMTMLLSKLAKEAENGNAKFFNFGERRIVGWAIQYLIMLHGPDATLGDVLQLINDKEELKTAALYAAHQLEQEDGTLAGLPIDQGYWADEHDAADLQAYMEYFKNLSAGIADELMANDTRTTDNFVTGARQALGAFNITTRSHKVTKTTSFRFADQKKKGSNLTVILTMDSSRLQAQKPIMELIQYCMLTEWKRAPNKSKHVYFQANECTNIEIFDLQSLLTWGRAYNIKLILYVQSLAAFRKMYGKDAVSTLLSECDAKLFLPGIREQESVTLVSKLCGMTSRIVRSHSGRSDDPYGVDGVSFKEEKKPLMSEEKVKHMKHAVLIIGDHVVRVWLTSISRIVRFRTMMGVSPYFNKPYLEFPTLILWRFIPWTPANIMRRTWSILRAKFSSISTKGATS